MIAVVPVLLIVMFAVNPLPQSFVAYATVQAPAAGGADVVTVTDADAGEVLPAASTATT